MQERTGQLVLLCGILTMLGIFATGCASGRHAEADPDERAASVDLQFIAVVLDADSSGSRRDLDRLRSLTSSGASGGDVIGTASERTPKTLQQVVASLNGNGRVYVLARPRIKARIGEEASVQLRSGGSTLTLTTRTVLNNAESDVLSVRASMEIRGDSVDRENQWSRLRFRGRTLGFSPAVFQVSGSLVGGSRLLGSFGTPVQPPRVETYIFAWRAED